MTNVQPYFPQPVFGGEAGDGRAVPRVLISPHRYIQGEGIVDHLGRYISVLPSTRPMILISAGGEKRFGHRIRRSLAAVNAEPVFYLFKGECSHKGVGRVVDAANAHEIKMDAVIAVGGGKCLDAGKCIAFRLNLPVVICPTIASTDAPCSAVSVMYTEEGVGKGPEFFPNSPAMVIMDTGIIAASPLRHLVAGMGDALATWYEARTCFNNPNARNMLGGRPTITALAISKLCAETIFKHGIAAVDAIKQKIINDSLEQIIEANTLLSGMGFESGGLAAAHGVAAGLTVIPVLHNDYLHGELVGMGLMTHLILEDNNEEAQSVATFLAQVGLPVHMGQLSLDSSADQAAIKTAMEAALESHLVASEPFTVTPENLLAAFLQANALGLKTAKLMGDAAYRGLHSMTSSGKNREIPAHGHH